MPFIDLATNCSVVQGLKPSLIAATGVGTQEIDTRGYSYALIVGNVGVWAGDGELDIYVCGSDTASFTPSSANRITGAALTHIGPSATTTAMNCVSYGGINLSGAPRYLELELVYAGTGGTSHDGDVGVTFILIPDDTGSLPVSVQAFRTVTAFDVQP